MTGSFNRIKNYELYRLKEESKSQHTIKGRTTNRIGRILRRNCLLKQVIEEQMEDGGMGRRGQRSKQLLDDLPGRKMF